MRIVASVATAIFLAMGCSAGPGAETAKPFTNSIGMELASIPVGEFEMGSPDSDKDAQADEKPSHRVRITRPFLIGTTEVTQAQWAAVMETRPWSGKELVRDGADYPATFVSWDDAMEFCKKLSAKEGKTYRLPTEAEWEYACRAGTTTRYSFGDDASKLSDYAWWGGSVRDGTASDERYAHRVATKPANPWGLYDMHGNVWEWCSDWYEEKYYEQKVETDPMGPRRGKYRVGRGDSWIGLSVYMRSADRLRDRPDRQDHNVGFRVVLLP